MVIDSLGFVLTFLGTGAAGVDSSTSSSGSLIGVGAVFNWPVGEGMALPSRITGDTLTFAVIIAAFADKWTDTVYVDEEPRSVSSLILILTSYTSGFLGFG